jgi:hypothetical protein
VCVLRASAATAILALLLLSGCGGTHAQGRRSEYRAHGGEGVGHAVQGTAKELPEFGSGADEQHAQERAMLAVQHRVHRKHPGLRFNVLTEAYTNTRTRFYDKAEGFLFAGRFIPEYLNREVNVVVEVHPDHSLSVVSYDERKVHHAPPMEVAAKIHKPQ